MADPSTTYDHTWCQCDAGRRGYYIQTLYTVPISCAFSHMRSRSPMWQLCHIKTPPPLNVYLGLDLEPISRLVNLMAPSSPSLTVTSSPAPSFGGSGGHQGGTTSSPLYLHVFQTFLYYNSFHWARCTYRFTFLATLILLVLISFAIVFRSLVLRRRFRHQMEEALAAGAILPMPSLRSNRRRRNRTDPGERPIIYDTWVTPGGEKWEYIMVRWMSTHFPLRCNLLSNTAI